MRFKGAILITLLFVMAFSEPGLAGGGPPKRVANNEEIIYHIFQRSFYDSNGDMQGDLNGIRQKLDYLQRLGVTAVLLTPLYESVFYHNYFASDFKKIDPQYGTLKNYLSLVKELHRRGMKFYMDMETQYVTEDHIWWKDGIKKLKSPYSNYILYQDNAHKQPSTIIFNLKGLIGYDSIYRK
jgi:alpha-amylase